MKPEEAKVIANFLAATLEMEAATTIRVIAAMPEGQNEYAPDGRSMKALELAQHIAGAEIMLIGIAIHGGATGLSPAYPEEVKLLATPGAVVEWYSTEQPKTLAQLRALTPEALASVVTVWGGAFSLPAVHYAMLALSHGNHHRGQLSAYLRPMGGRVPSIYGPSGDEELAAS